MGGGGGGDGKLYANGYYQTAPQQRTLCEWRAGTIGGRHQKTVETFYSIQKIPNIF